MDGVIIPCVPSTKDFQYNLYLPRCKFEDRAYVVDAMIANGYDAHIVFRVTESVDFDESCVRVHIPMYRAHESLQTLCEPVDRRCMARNMAHALKRLIACGQ